jgi:hypothetical protein
MVLYFSFLHSGYLQLLARSGSCALLQLIVQGRRQYSRLSALCHAIHYVSSACYIVFQLLGIYGVFLGWVTIRAAHLNYTSHNRPFNSWLILIPAQNTSSLHTA